MKNNNHTLFEMIDFANYVLNNRRMNSHNGDVGYNEFIGWLEARKPQEFIRRVREYKIDLIFSEEKTGGYSHLSDDEIKEIDDKLEDRFKNKKNKDEHTK